MSNTEWQQMTPEIRRKILPPGQQMMSMLVEFKKGGFGTAHSHPHEQLGYIIRGKVKMILGSEEIIAVEGEQVLVPGDVPHSILALEDSLVLESFTPLRHDLLATLQAVDDAKTEG